MKKSVLILILISGAFAAKAQTPQDVFNPSVPITWLGLDFSEARIIGDHAAYADKDINNLFLAWNELMLAETKKYDVAGATGRSKVDHNTTAVNEKNKTVDATKVLSNDTKDHNRLTSEDIQTLINGYNFEGVNDIGLIFVIESFNKMATEAAIYVTFIDPSTRKVIFTERVTAAPSGFGIRNYWAGAIYKVMKKMSSTDFKAWKKKYE